MNYPFSQITFLSKILWEMYAALWPLCCLCYIKTKRDKLSRILKLTNVQLQSRNFNSLKNGMYLRVLVHCFGTNHYQLYDGSVDNVYNVASILPSGLFFKTTSNTRSNRHGFLSELGIPRENAANFEQPCLASMDAKNAPGYVPTLLEFTLSFCSSLF